MSAPMSIALVIALLGALLMTVSAGATECRDLFRAPKASSKVALSPVESRTGFVDVDGRIAYFEQIVAKPGKPTALVFVGLFTPLVDFAELQAEFVKQTNGEGLILFAYSTQVESLMVGSFERPDTYADKLRVDLNDVVMQAVMVLKAAGVRRPATIVGYSYGSAPAAKFVEIQPELTRSLLFVSPLVLPGDHLPRYDVTSQAFRNLAAMNPFFGHMVIESARQFNAREAANHFLKDFAKGEDLPNGLTHQRLVDGLTYLIRAADGFDLRNANVRDWPETHFLFAAEESPARLELQKQVVAAVEKVQGAIPGAVVTVPNSEHRLIFQRPDIAAGEILRSMRPNKARR